MAENPSLYGSITTDDALGKEVIDTKGAFLGVSDKLYINPKSLKVIAVSIDKGFMKKGLLISTSYIREITPHAIFLNIEPAFKIKGMLVFDIEGAKVGRVISVSLNNSMNSIDEIFVRKSFPRFGHVTISSNELARVESSVFLNVSKQKIYSAKPRKN